MSFLQKYPLDLWCRQAFPVILDLGCLCRSLRFRCQFRRMCRVCLYPKCLCRNFRFQCQFRRMCPVVLHSVCLNWNCRHRHTDRKKTDGCKYSEGSKNTLSNLLHKILLKKVRNSTPPEFLSINSSFVSGEASTSNEDFFPKQALRAAFEPAEGVADKLCLGAQGETSPSCTQILSS